MLVLSLALLIVLFLPYLGMCICVKFSTVISAISTIFGHVFVLALLSVLFVPYLGIRNCVKGW